jgi:hypothetical protein
MWYITKMEWSRFAVVFMLPFALWLLTFAVLAIQILFLLFFETRVASGILDRKFSDYALAALGVAALLQYDQVIALPLMTSVYPEQMRSGAREILVVFLAGFSMLSAGIAFHFSISHVTRFKGRSLLVFPQDVYEKDPISVRQLWIKIFNLIGLTSMVIVALIHVWVFFFVRILGKVDGPVVLSFILGLGIAGFLAQPARSLILRYPSDIVVMAKLNQVIAQSAKPPEVRRSLSPRKSDPIGWARGELIHIARILERLARREDSRFGAGISDPVAVIYRAVADHIKTYCSSPKSLKGSVPASLISTLKATEGFMITGDNAWRGQLVRRMNISQGDGVARADSAAPAAGSAMRIIRVAARYADLALIWLQNRWQAIVIALAVAAFLFGALDLKSLLGVVK